MEKEDKNGSALTLPRNTQLRALAIAGVVVFTTFFVVPLLWHALSRPPAPPLPVMVSGQFHPTPAQLSDLPIDTAVLRRFPGLVQTDGTIAQNDDATTPVFSPFSGAVVRILVRAGDKVEKGAPLMIVAATEAVQSESDLIAAADAESAAQAAAKNAMEIEKRQQALYDAGSVALKDWHQSQVDLTTAQGALKTADAALIAARGKLNILGFTPKQIARLEQSRETKASSSEAVVTAPISGIVIQRQVGVGQFIQAGAATPVFSIGKPASLWLLGNVREEDAPSMRVGEPVDVSLTALPGRTLHTQLDWVAAAIDTTTHRLPVRAEIANPDGTLKPAMFAALSIHVGNDRVSPAVPESAVIREGNVSHIWVAQNNGNLSLRPSVPVAWKAVTWKFCPG